MILSAVIDKKTFEMIQLLPMMFKKKRTDTHVDDH